MVWFSLLKQRLKLGLNTFFCTVIISSRVGGGEEVKLFFSSVTACILSADDLQACRVMKESKRNCKAAVNQVEIVGILRRAY